MRIAHLADLHLGFRQFDRLAPSGINQREQDVADTFARAIDLVIAQAPDVVVIGGDVFHHSHPSNPATVHAFNGFARLRKALPAAPIVIVAGNHDAPRTSDAGCMLQLFRGLRMHVVERAAEVLVFPELDLEVLAVPDVVGIERPSLRPTTASRHKVLLLHGEIAGMLPVATSHDIAVHELHADAWDVVCLGHWHVAREVAPRCWYSGSIDYTSTNPWGELAEQAERSVRGKGFLVHELTTGETEFVPLPPSRAYVDLGPIDCAALSAAEIDAAIQREVIPELGTIDDAVARLVLTNCPRHRLRELDQDALRALRERALHLQLVPRAPEAAPALVSVEQAKRTSLEVLLRTALTTRDLPPDLDRTELVDAGALFLKRATDATRPVAVEA
jgi:DNA repair exonuclease SbcCD nuclease subunit